MEIIKAANLALSFLLELCALAALGYWGFQTGQSERPATSLGSRGSLRTARCWIASRILESGNGGAWVRRQERT